MSRPAFTTEWFVAHEAEKRAKKATQRIQPRPTAKSEADIQNEIADWLRSLGRECYWVRSRMDKATTNAIGTPDFIGWHRGQPWAMEVKRPGQKQRREQAGELMRCELAGGRAAVVHSLAEAVEFLKGKQ